MTHKKYTTHNILKTYSESGQPSKTEIFAEIANGYQSLPNFKKGSILDVLNKPLQKT